jgi:hypothetical protein
LNATGSERRGRRVAWLVVSFVTVPAALSLRFMSYLVGPDSTPLFMLGLAIVVSAGTAGLALLLPGSRPFAIDDRWSRWSGAALALLMLGWLFYLIVGSPQMSRGAAMTMVAAAVAVAIAALPRWRPGAIAALAVLASVSIAAWLISIESFAASGGDMLDLIETAVTRVLDGRFPYQDLRVPGSVQLEYSARPVPYPPMMWLAFLPFRAAGLDLRLLPLLAAAAVGLLLWRAARRAGSAAAGLADVLLPTLFLAPIFVLRVISIQTPPQWLLMCVIVLVARGPRSAPWVGVLSGVALGMRESTLVLLPLLLLYYWLRAPRQALGFLAALAATSAVIFVPFILIDADAFISSMVYNAAYVMRLERPLNHVGLGPWIANSVGAGAASALQAGLCTAIYVVAYRRMRTAAELAVLMGLAYLIFMLVNPLIHEYYYLNGLILIALGLFLGSEPESLSARVVPASISGRSPAT